MIILTIFTPSALYQTQHNTWQENLYSANLTALRLTIDYCLQMENQRSVEMLAFNFASIILAYKRLAQGLSRSVSAFSSFMREYLDPVVKVDQCAQFVDYFGVAAINATNLTRNTRAVFQCIPNARLKLTIEKSQFGVRQVEFLGRTISSEGVSPQSHKVKNFLK